MPDESDSAYFRLFNEIAILDQLSRALLQTQLPEGILVSHFAVLNHLVRVKDGRTPLELAHACQVAKTTMSHTLTGLHQLGFIKMLPNKDDARSKRVWITKKGCRFRVKAISAVAPEIASLELDFAVERIRAILPELEELRKIMDERRDRQR